MKKIALYACIASYVSKYYSTDVHQDMFEVYALACWSLSMYYCDRRRDLSPLQALVIKNPQTDSKNVRAYQGCNAKIGTRDKRLRQKADGSKEQQPEERLGHVALEGCSQPNPFRYRGASFNHLLRQ